jgi:hypothetical protein
LRAHTRAKVKKGKFTQQYGPNPAEMMVFAPIFAQKPETQKNKSILTKTKS